MGLGLAIVDDQPASRYPSFSTRIERAEKVILASLKLRDAGVALVPKTLTLPYTYVPAPTVQGPVTSRSCPSPPSGNMAAVVGADHHGRRVVGGGGQDCANDEGDSDDPDERSPESGRDRLTYRALDGHAASCA
jgi:hypothetical protein